MKIYSVFDPEFKPYGQIVKGIDETVQEILAGLAETPLPDGVGYVPTEPILQNLPAAEVISNHCFGGMPVQLGWCNGHNTKLNCLEYHRDSEVNIGTHDFVLLLAKQDQIVDGVLDTALVKAFRVPAGVPVEVFGTSLHYAPCHTDAADGFRVAIVLPKGTNTQKPDFAPVSEEDRWMTARNKWLLAHPDSAEAKSGAHIGLKGENIDIG